MNLLLFLTALLSGLAGAISGESRVESARVEHAASAIETVEAAAEAAIALSSRTQAPRAETSSSNLPTLAPAAPARDVLSITGSRLE